MNSGGRELRNRRLDHHHGTAFDPESSLIESGIDAFFNDRRDPEEQRQAVFGVPAPAVGQFLIDGFRRRPLGCHRVDAAGEPIAIPELPAVVANGSLAPARPGRLPARYRRPTGSWLRQKWLEGGDQLDRKTNGPPGQVRHRGSQLLDGQHLVPAEQPLAPTGRDSANLDDLGFDDEVLAASSRSQETGC